jgi:hypothetical protein
MAVLNLCVLTLYTAVSNLYLYELFYGNWEMRIIKGLFYLTTSIVLLYTIIAEMKEYKNYHEYRTNIICKLSILANFVTFALTQLNSLPKPEMYLFLLNGSILAITVVILTTFGKHGHFD